MAPYLLWHPFADACRRDPHQIALIDRDRYLSYGELDRLSGKLALGLRQRGIGPGDRVGVHLPKSALAVVALLGVLKVGAAYVPLDPNSPVPRLALIADDCRLAALVGDGPRLAKLLPALAAIPPFSLSMEGGLESPPAGIEVVEWPTLLAEEGEAAVYTEAIETDLAYILYTSGSTGQPKGVMISHRAALSFVNWAVDHFGLGPADRLSSHAPLHFDLSIFDLFAGLAAGATVALVPAEAAIFPYSLAAWMAAQRISVWYSASSVLTQLTLHGELVSHDLFALRLILFAGEVFPARHLKRLCDLLPQPRYFNLYGPTESNVCTLFEVEATDGETPAPIGRACANMGVFALNELGAPIGPRELGELYVRGPGLMSGYWGMPELTAKVLIPNPLAPERGELVYRTGDLVRLEPDGSYRFAGRRDGMVKSRGYRIELGEIEAVLQSHPDVIEAAVVALPDEEVGSRLHAFVSVVSSTPPDSAVLAAHCRMRLPAYMVPERIRLGPLPKTSTDKIDRQRLAAAVSDQ